LSLTGPICARALNFAVFLNLCVRGHHDWPVKLPEYSFYL
jgi:hypothetical protein